MLSQNSQVVFKYRRLPTFFKQKVQPLIRAEYKSCCALCTKPLGPGEGVCIPILEDMRTMEIACGLWYATKGDIKAASNGELGCDICCKFLADPDGRDYERLSAFVPCQQILDYLASVFPKLAGKDLATRMQTVDQILEDLEKFPSSSPERRAAAPFLHCYQLQPVRALNPRYPQEFSHVVLYDPPACTVIDGRSYRIFDTSEVDTSVSADRRLSRSVVLPLYEQTKSDTVTLWRIRGRSAGSFMGCAEAICIARVGDTKLYDTLLSVYHLSSWKGRGISLRELNPSLNIETPEVQATRLFGTFFPLPPGLDMPPGLEPTSSSEGSISVMPLGLEPSSSSEGSSSEEARADDDKYRDDNYSA